MIKLSLLGVSLVGLSACSAPCENRSSEDASFGIELPMKRGDAALCMETESYLEWADFSTEASALEVELRYRTMLVEDGWSEGSSAPPEDEHPTSMRFEKDKMLLSIDIWERREKGLPLIRTVVTSQFSLTKW